VAYSMDLRLRVIGAINAGVSTRAAGRRFSIGESTAGAWHRRWRALGHVRPGQQGGREGSKLDPFEAVILGLVAETRDITLVELTEQLGENHGLRTCPSSLCDFFKKRDITFKKNCARR